MEDASGVDITTDDASRLITRIIDSRASGEGHCQLARKAQRQVSKLMAVRANCVGRMLQKVFNPAVRPWKTRDDNPAEGFLPGAETERERFLSLKEVNRLANALP